MKRRFPYCNDRSVTPYRLRPFTNTTRFRFTTCKMSNNRRSRCLRRCRGRELTRMSKMIRIQIMRKVNANFCKRRGNLCLFSTSSRDFNLRRSKQRHRKNGHVLRHYRRLTTCQGGNVIMVVNRHYTDSHRHLLFRTKQSSRMTMCILLLRYPTNINFINRILHRARNKNNESTSKSVTQDNDIIRISSARKGILRLSISGSNNRRRRARRK